MSKTVPIQTIHLFEIKYICHTSGIKFMCNARLPSPDFFVLNRGYMDRSKKDYFIQKLLHHRDRSIGNC